MSLTLAYLSTTCVKTSPLALAPWLKSPVVMSTLPHNNKPMTCAIVAQMLVLPDAWLWLRWRLHMRHLCWPPHSYGLRLTSKTHTSTMMNHKHSNVLNNSSTSSTTGSGDDDDSMPDAGPHHNRAHLRCNTIQQHPARNRLS